MWDWLVDPNAFNVVLNLLGVILGGGALGVVLTHLRGMRSLENTEVADIRKHYAEELAAMRRRDDERDEAMRALEAHWREMVNLADKRHAECVAEREELRDQLTQVKSELAGVKDQLRAQAADRVLILEETCTPPSPQVAEAARRVRKIVEDKGNGK